MKRFYQTVAKSEISKKPRRVFVPVEETSAPGIVETLSFTESKQTEILATEVNQSGVHHKSTEGLEFEIKDQVVEGKQTEITVQTARQSREFISVVQTSRTETTIETKSAVPFPHPISLLSETEIQHARRTPTNVWVAKSNLLLKLSPLIDNSTRTGVVAFDLDGNLIVTKSGKAFAENKNDWKFFHSSVPAKLQSAYAQGYSLAIISNQKGIDNSKDQKELQEKIDCILQSLSVPMDVICSHEEDVYRKPRTGMWEYLWEARWRLFPQALQRESCFYIGDAAGRPAGIGGKKKDFSDTDYKFAINLNIQVSSSFFFFLLRWLYSLLINPFFYENTSFKLQKGISSILINESTMIFLIPRRTDSPIISLPLLPILHMIKVSSNRLFQVSKRLFS
jgi:DNA 3'-phosphatase